MTRTEVDPRPFRYFDNSRDTDEVGKKSDVVSLRLDHGVLVASVLVNGMMQEQQLRDVTEQIEAGIPRAKTGVVVDCSKVTLSVSSAFLGKLMQLSKKTNERNLPMVVCGLRGPLKEAFDVACFHRAIPVHETQRAAVEQLGEFNEWERLSMESVAQENDRKKRSDKPQFDAAKLLTPRVKKIAAGAAITMLSVAVVCMVVARLSDRQPANAAMWESAPRTPIEGEVTYVARGVNLEDSGSVVIAWPAGFMPPNKHSMAAATIFGQDDSADQLTPYGPFVAKATSDGTYSLHVPVPEVDCNYYVLILSAHSKTGRPLLASDRAVLQMYFDDPDTLVEGHDYHLARCSLSVGQVGTVAWTAGRKQNGSAAW